MRTTQMIATAATSGGSSGIWLGVMAAAFLLAVGATGAAVMRHRPADDQASESSPAETTGTE